MSHILVFSPYALWPSHTTYEEVIAQACQSHGASIEYVLCDGLPECDQHWDSKSPAGRPDDICRRCQAASRANLERLRFPHTWLSQSLSVPERQEAITWAQNVPPASLREATYHGLPLGQWVLSTVISYFRQYPPDTENPRVVSVYRNFLQGAAVVATALGNILDARPAEAAILFNGRQSLTRVAFEIFRARNVRVLTHERAEYLRGHVNVKPNAHCMSTQPFKDQWARWRGVPLDKAALESTFHWLIQRRYGANLAWIPFNKSYRQNASGRIAASDGVSKTATRQIWALFTSSTDEVAGDPLWQGPYESQAEWVRDVIRWVANRDDVELVIKVHPNLGGNIYIGKAASELSFYERMQPTLPANVRMIFPHESVSAYALADRANVVLTFGSTIGMEMAMLGKPVLLASRAIYEDASHVLKVDSPSSLSALLEKCLQARPSRETQREAFRLAHRYFSTELPFPAVTVHDLFDVAVDITYRKSGMWDRDPSLERIRGFLLQETDLYASPSADDLARTTEEEDRFFDQLVRRPARLRSWRYESMLWLKDLSRRITQTMDRVGIPANFWLLDVTRRQWHAVLRRMERRRA